MANLLKFIPEGRPRSYLTDGELETFLGGTPNSRYGRVKRLLAQGKLVRLRRGLYSWVEENEGRGVKSHPFELAQHIYAPSVISLESAFSFHQLIPETVYAVTSVCAKRNKEFSTPLGVFSYRHTPLPNFYTEVDLIVNDDERYFMAKPWRALCDYIFCYKKDWCDLKSVISSLRVEEESLPKLREDEIENLELYYRSRRISRFLKGVRRR